ncbi:MAG TPA: hypothetical protein VHJ18_00950 [Streptosporangiaceae bacterium]|jgi:hypothetical protein|nr:hypothetical protein [Streptosporangiaceae bacterium]
MTLPRIAVEVLSEHVVFEVEWIDRMYLNVYVPQLQQPAGPDWQKHPQQFARLGSHCGSERARRTPSELSPG